jgi:NCS2 family nucleobase:cation symporter-2
MSVFLLNLVFRIGAKRSVVLEFEKSDTPAAELERLLRARGKTWSIAPDVIDRAVQTTEQVSIRYQGALRALPNVGVRRHFFLEEESFSYGLADFLTGVYPDRMEARSEGQNAEIRLIFGS